MDVIDTLLGASMVVLSSIILILWARVTLKVSQMEDMQLKVEPIELRDISVENLGKTD
jgi:hypothetical protein